jgi:hypothetical protein
MVGAGDLRVLGIRRLVTMVHVVIGRARRSLALLLSVVARRVRALATVRVASPVMVVAITGFAVAAAWDTEARGQPDESH